MSRFSRLPFLSVARGCQQRISATRSFLIAAGIVGAGFSSGAFAQEAKSKWSRCMVTDTNKMDIYYYSAVFELPPNQTEASASFSAGFLSWIKASVDSSVNMVACVTRPTAEWYEQHDNRIVSEKYQHVAQVRTDFRNPGNPPAPPVVPGISRVASAPAGLIIEDNGIAAKAQAWADSVLQMRREEAARKVKTALATTESKARNETLRQKMLAEMRARRNKQ